LAFAPAIFFVLIRSAPHAAKLDLLAGFQPRVNVNLSPADCPGAQTNRFRKLSLAHPLVDRAFGNSSSFEYADKAQNSVCHSSPNRRAANSKARAYP
ncbi:hypothetical protein, partial [Burkholderia pseudomallei]|uniref:hypothetical protein n=1 Tax=Burkholderia pseudomallei TaxID=28450 RepID=UPI003C7B7DA2